MDRQNVIPMQIFLHTYAKTLILLNLKPFDYHKYWKILVVLSQQNFLVFLTKLSIWVVKNAKSRTS